MFAPHSNSTAQRALVSTRRDHATCFLFLEFQMLPRTNTVSSTLLQWKMLNLFCKKTAYSTAPVITIQQGCVVRPIPHRLRQIHRFPVDPRDGVTGLPFVRRCPPWSSFVSLYNSSLLAPTRQHCCFRCTKPLPKCHLSALALQASFVKITIAPCNNAEQQRHFI
jgi:hypothetical protein